MRGKRPGPRRPRIEAIRGRFDQPIERATRITRRTMAWFPIRVWRHFLQHNGFLLAAGISYQALFAIFGAIYLVFAGAGLWLGGSEQAVQVLSAVVDRYIPGLINEHGLIKPEQVEEVARGSGGLLTITGIVAAVVVIWTAIGFVTYTRRAVRDTFGLPFDRRGYVMLKARDLAGAVMFGVALLLGAGLGSIAIGAIDFLFSLLGWGTPHDVWLHVLARVVSLAIAFCINAAALGMLFRLLTGISLPWRIIRPGALLGGAAMVMLQLAAGLLLVYTPTNPLLATFGIFIGFLLWFRLNGIVILVSAAWIAVSASDRDLSLYSDEERLIAEHAALLTAARVRLRMAEETRGEAPWWRARRAERELGRARDQLAEVVAAAPPPMSRSILD